MRVGQTSFIAFASRGVSSAAGFVATVLFARLLGPEILGNYYLLLALMGWLGLVGSMGFGTAITKRLSEGTDRAQYKVAGILILGGFTGVILVGLLAFQSPIERYIGGRAVEFLAILVVVGLLGTYVDAVLKGLHRVHLASLLKPVRRIMRTLLQVAGVLAGYGLVALVLGYALGGLLMVLLGIYFIGGRYRFPARSHLSSLFTFAKFSWLGRLSGRTFNQADIIILGVFVPSTLVGVYGVTWNLAFFLGLFSSSLTNAIFPEISKLSVQDRRESITSLVNDSLAYAGLITIPGLFGGFLLSERILRIYGGEFLQGMQVLVILILSVLLYSYLNQVTNALNGINHPESSFKANGLLIGSNILLNLLLVYYFGMIGAALASACSALISTVFGYYLLRQHLPVAIPVGPITKQLIAGGGMAAVVWAIEQWVSSVGIEGSNLLVTLSLVLVGATVFFGIYLGISPRFRTTVFDNIPSHF